MSTPTLNRTECNALRGLAIIGIFLHNYCHWLGPIVKENEYQYIQRNVDWLHQVMASPDGWLPMHLLSFFGHYGVPVFLFLSAYGLVLKYESGPRLTQGAERFSITGRHLPNLGEGLRFVRYHYLKLFKMMIVGFVAFTMLDYLTPGPHHYQSLDIIAMLGMFNNVLPNPDRIIWPGPFWFFGLMLQLYIIYRLFIYRRHWAFTVVLMVVCLALQLCLSPDGEAMNRYRYNFMGGVLPFCAGLLYARHGKKLTHGVRMTLNMLLDGLKRFGFEEVPSLGEQFDPELHNAVMREAGEEPGKILEVFQKGYRVKDKIIRYAMVKVCAE